MLLACSSSCEGMGENQLWQALLNALTFASVPIKPRCLCPCRPAERFPLQVFQNVGGISS